MEKLNKNKICTCLLLPPHLQEMLDARSHYPQPIVPFLPPRPAGLNQGKGRFSGIPFPDTPPRPALKRLAPKGSSAPNFYLFRAHPWENCLPITARTVIFGCRLPPRVKKWVLGKGKMLSLFHKIAAVLSCCNKYIDQQIGWSVNK